MPFNDPNNLGIIESLVLSLFAAFGGLFAYLQRTYNKDQKPTITKCLIEFGASAFVGLIAMLVCKATGLDWYWSGVIVGVCGWLGAETSISFFARMVRKKLGIEENDTTT